MFIFLFVFLGYGDNVNDLKCKESHGKSLVLNKWPKLKVFPEQGVAKTKNPSNSLRPFLTCSECYFNLRTNRHVRHDREVPHEQYLKHSFVVATLTGCDILPLCVCHGVSVLERVNQQHRFTAVVSISGQSFCLEMKPKLDRNTLIVHNFSGQT